MDDRRNAWLSGRDDKSLAGSSRKERPGHKRWRVGNGVKRDWLIHGIDDDDDKPRNKSPTAAAAAAASLISIDEMTLQAPLFTYSLVPISAIVSFMKRSFSGEITCDDDGRVSPYKPA